MFLGSGSSFFRLIPQRIVSNCFIFVHVINLGRICESFKKSLDLSSWNKKHSKKKCLVVSGRQHRHKSESFTPIAKPWLAKNERPSRSYDQAAVYDNCNQNHEKEKIMRLMIKYTHFVCCFSFVIKGTILIIKIKQKCIDVSKISCQ